MKFVMMDCLVGGVVEMIYWYCNKYSYFLEIEVDVFMFELFWKEIFEVMNIFGEDVV